MSTNFFHLCWFFHSKKTQHLSPRANYHLLFHFFHLNANSVRQFLSQPTSMMPLGCWMSRKKINRWCLTGTGSFCEIVACGLHVTRIPIIPCHPDKFPQRIESGIIQHFDLAMTFINITPIWCLIQGIANRKWVRTLVIPGHCLNLPRRTI